MHLNKKRGQIQTHEGAKAKHINYELQLRRTVMACMLWEKQFYESGKTIADRISELVPKVLPGIVADQAVEARSDMYLRHIPLLIVREMSRLDSHKYLVSLTLSRIIQRPDELTEFLAIYWMDGRQPLSAQVKKGLALAFGKFDEYQLAKYNRNTEIKLKDVLFLCHAKPKDKEQADIWKRLVEDNLKTPDTWEVALSSGGDKKDHWTRLLKENKLGAMALLRNLRNMDQAGVDESLVKNALINANPKKILPFRFIAAANNAVHLESEIEVAMLKCLSEHDKIPGHTVLLLDVSGSMESKVSGKSQISRLDAACGVGMLLREICEKIDIYSFSMKLCRVPSRHGFALRDVINNSQEHSGTPLGLAVKSIYADKSFSQSSASFGWGRNYETGYQGQQLNPDRLIVITDEQSCDPVPDPSGVGYMVNVASNKNGVGYGPWLHIDGWSESIINYIRDIERSKLN